MFFTFNHPSRKLLVEMANRIATAAGLPVLDVGGFGEPLDLIVPPQSEAMNAALGNAPGQLSPIFGLDVDSKGFSIPRTRREYSLESLVEAFYFSYRCQFGDEAPGDLRFTPAL